MTLSPLTAATFGGLKKRDPNYYSGRWPYLSLASDLAMQLKPESILELGPYRRPLIGGSDVMDLNDYLADGKVKWKWDARKTPWPVEDNAYDLFIALQVWEHLGREQAAAFREVMRISKTAILSFPYLWQLADTGDCHHGIGDGTIREWICGVRPTKKVIVDKPNPKYKRAIYVFDFRDGP